MTFLNKLHLHPVFILFIAISFITGTFVQLFILFFIIFIHELGHYVMAAYFRWDIHAIVLWVFGGVMKTNEGTQRPIKEDVLVTIAGPLQHFVIFILLYGCMFVPQIPDHFIQMGFFYNMILLIFNLLPIYPMDGGKLLFYTLSAIIPFKQAHKITIKFSMIACGAIIVMQLFLLPFTLSAFILISFIIWENWNEWKHHTIIFIRFLLNRTVNDKKQILSVPGHVLLMEVFSCYRRNRTHPVRIHGEQGIMSESDSLLLYFKQQKTTETIRELMIGHHRK